MDSAMSSWVALRRRVEFEPGASVLVLGATRNAGRMAIQVAKHLGAARVIGAARRADQLATLPAFGADATVQLDDAAPDKVAGRLAEASGDIDVVIDYLWGEPAGSAMIALVRDRVEESKPLAWIQIGRSPAIPPRSRPPRCAPCACRSSAAARAPSPPAASSPNCPPRRRDRPRHLRRQRPRGPARRGHPGVAVHRRGPSRRHPPEPPRAGYSRRASTARREERELNVRGR
jgi:Zinc-binding dehydrogenase